MWPETAEEAALLEARALSMMAGKPDRPTAGGTAGVAGSVVGADGARDESVGTAGAAGGAEAG